MPKDTFIKPLPSAEYLRACFDFNPETGELRWNHRPREHFSADPIWMMWNKQNAGTSAGSVVNGYRVVCLDRRPYRAHRIIWKLMIGIEPPPCPDHKDRDKLNNRWSNLRPATYAESAWNRGHKSNTSGYKGTYRHRSRWSAGIMINGIRHYLGTFDTRAGSGSRL